MNVRYGVYLECKTVTAMTRNMQRYANRERYVRNAACMLIAGLLVLMIVKSAIDIAQWRLNDSSYITKLIFRVWIEIPLNAMLLSVFALSAYIDYKYKKIIYIFAYPITTICTLIIFKYEILTKKMVIALSIQQIITIVLMLMWPLAVLRIFEIMCRKIINDVWFALGVSVFAAATILTAKWQQMGDSAMVECLEYLVSILLVRTLWNRE